MEERRGVNRPPVEADGLSGRERAPPGIGGGASPSSSTSAVSVQLTSTPVAKTTTDRSRFRIVAAGRSEG